MNQPTEQELRDLRRRGYFDGLFGRLKSTHEPIYLEGYEMGIKRREDLNLEEVEKEIEAKETITKLCPPHLDPPIERGIKRNA